MRNRMKPTRNITSANPVLPLLMSARSVIVVVFGWGVRVVRLDRLDRVGGHFDLFSGVRPDFSLASSRSVISPLAMRSFSSPFLRAASDGSGLGTN
jgi:hypothetical protein